MKAKYILSSLLLAGCTFFSSCEDNLDISQHGVSTFENFYKTDADAEEAIIACYSNWKDTYKLDGCQCAVAVDLYVRL